MLKKNMIRTELQKKYFKRKAAYAYRLRDAAFISAPTIKALSEKALHLPIKSTRSQIRRSIDSPIENKRAYKGHVFFLYEDDKDVYQPSDITPWIPRTLTKDYHQIHLAHIKVPKPVVIFKETGEYQFYDCVNDCAYALDTPASNISRVLTGYNKGKTNHKNNVKHLRACGWYIWYEKDWNGIDDAINVIREA